jgi:hypothetical protein
MASKLRIILNIEGYPYIGGRALRAIEESSLRLIPMMPADVRKQPRWQRAVWLFERMQGYTRKALTILREKKHTDSHHSKYAVLCRLSGQGRMRQRNRSARAAQQQVSRRTRRAIAQASQRIIAQSRAIGTRINRTPPPLIPAPVPEPNAARERAAAAVNEALGVTSRSGRMRFTARVPQVTPTVVPEPASEPQTTMRIWRESNSVPEPAPEPRVEGRSGETVWTLPVEDETPQPWIWPAYDAPEGGLR